MAFTASTVLEVRTTGSDTANGGGFDADVSGFPTDGVVTDANTASPVFSSASYACVAGDIGAWWYLKAGTSGTPGWYQVVSVAAGAATLNAAIGQAVLAAGYPTTVLGCGTAASLSSITWGMDYSQQASPQISFTDLMIDGAVNTNFTSAANPVGKNFVGNLISVTSGTGFTVQRVAVVSTSGTTATCDKSLGTLGSTGGVGGIGGALASPGQAGELVTVADMVVHIASGTYSITSASTNIAGGCVLIQVRSGWLGYGTIRGDYGTRPVLSASGIESATIFGNSGIAASLHHIEINGQSLSAIRGCGYVTTALAAYSCIVRNCSNHGFWNTSPTEYCLAVGCSIGFEAAGSAIDCVATGCTSAGFNSVYTNGLGPWVRCISYANLGASTDGFRLSSKNNAMWSNCVSYGNGRDGFRVTTSYACILCDCVSEGNGAYGINVGSMVYRNIIVNCATYLNTSGAINGTPIYVNANVTGTASFFADAAGGDFSLNNESGGGALLRSAGIPGVFPGGLTTGYLDIGAAQHADPDSRVRVYPHDRVRVYQ